ncbi:MAG: hypothetical protein WA763_08410, partial [Pseudolabrys sp.]
MTRIVGGIQVFETQGTNGRYLGDVLTGLCPVEVRRIARQNDDTTGRIRLHPIAVELIVIAVELIVSFPKIPSGLDSLFLHSNFH